MRIPPVLARHGWLIAIAVAYLYVFPYFPKIKSANELPRIYLVKAIADEHRFAIDTGVRRWGSTGDVSPSGGHQYSNKAPGSSMLAAAPYLVARTVAGEPSLPATFWIARVFTGVIPMLAFLVLLYRFLERVAPDPAIRKLVLVAYALGSMAMTYSILFYSHQLSAVCAAGAWIIALDVVDGRRRPWLMLFAGALAGAAPLVDYQAAFALVPAAIHVVARMLLRARASAATPSDSTTREATTSASTPSASTASTSTLSPSTASTSTTSTSTASTSSTSTSTTSTSTTSTSTPSRSTPSRSTPSTSTPSTSTPTSTPSTSTTSRTDASLDTNSVTARQRALSTRPQVVRALALAAIGAAVPIAILLGYHTVCFGSPLRTGYDASTVYAHHHQAGFLGITELRLEAFVGSFFKVDNGLFTLAPWFLLAIPGAVLAWRHREQRGLVAVGASVAAIYILFISSINFWRGGWGVGPRYITVMLPFLVPLVAAGLQAWARRPLVVGAAGATMVVGIAIYTLSSATFPYWPDSFSHPLVDVTFRMLREDLVTPSLGSALGIEGVVGLAPYFLVVGGVVVWTITKAGTWRAVAIALAVGCAVLVTYSYAFESGGPKVERPYKFVRASVVEAHS